MRQWKSSFRSRGNASIDKPAAARVGCRFCADLIDSLRARYKYS